MNQSRRQFIDSMIRQGVLRFGDFKLKCGRRSPYFFNLGHVSQGPALAELGGFYADAIESAGVQFDVLFGPAYKGIPIAVATAIALAGRGRTVGVAFNRKEAKTHGEGGLLVGAPLSGRVLMVDDVVSAGTAKREAAAIIKDAGAALAGIVIALDRQEIIADGETAVDQLSRSLNAPVISIVTLKDVIEFLRHDDSAERKKQLAALEAHHEDQGGADFPRQNRHRSRRSTAQQLERSGNQHCNAEGRHRIPAP